MVNSPTLDNVQQNAPGTSECFEAMSTAYRGGFLRQKEGYKLDNDIVNKIEKYANDYVIVAIFGEWCGDSRHAIPVLSLLEEKVGFEVRALSGMKRAAWNSGKQWDVPPSPREVDVFNITSSPTIIIFKKSGEEIGRIKTKPKMTPTVEAEILKIIEDSKTSNS